MGKRESSFEGFWDKPLQDLLQLLQAFPLCGEVLTSTGPKPQFAASLTAMSNIDHTCEPY